MHNGICKKCDTYFTNAVLKHGFCPKCIGEILETINLKFTSGNSVTVERITLRRTEIFHEED